MRDCDPRRPLAGHGVRRALGLDCRRGATGVLRCPRVRASVIVPLVMLLVVVAEASPDVAVDTVVD